MISKISLVLVACLNTFVFSFPHNSGIHPRIVNGSDAAPGQFPYAVSIRGFNGWNYEHVCGGVIVSSHWVLTSGAYCDGLTLLQNRPQAKVGTNKLNAGGTIYDIEKLVMHPEYNHTTFYVFENDLCLLRLSKDLEKSDLVQNITLASPEDDLIQNVTIAGWGLVDNDHWDRRKDLQFLETTLEPNDKCDELWKPHPFYYPIQETNICTSTEGQIGICGADRGGPLVVKDKNGVEKLVGIASYNDACATGFPDVHTRVSKYVEWIKSVIER